MALQDRGQHVVKADRTLEQAGQVAARVGGGGQPSYTPGTRVHCVVDNYTNTTTVSNDDLLDFGFSQVLGYLKVHFIVKTKKIT